MQRYMPEPFALGILLTFVTLTLAWTFTPATAEDVLVAWGGGLSDLLPFITQICLTLLFTIAFVRLGPVPGWLTRLAQVPKTPRAAYAYVAALAGCLSLMAWPLGLIGSGLMARRVALAFRERGKPVHYPLLAAAAFSGCVVIQMGYSGTIPLLAATEGNPLQEMLGGVLPVNRTTLAPFNLVAVVATLAAVVLAAPILRPGDRDSEPIAETEGPNELLAPAEAPPARVGLAAAIERSRWVTAALGLLVVAYLVRWFQEHGARFDLNIVNWTFLAACLLIARSPVELVGALAPAGRIVVLVLLQYPIYGGIMGIMLDTGLAARIAALGAAFSSAETLPLVAFLSAGVINLFIPSGGAQWAVQGPAFLEAAKTLGTDPALIVMAVAYGDQWTNLIHPFVAIPLLLLTGLPAYKVLAYSFLLCLVAGVPLATALLVASL
ncbi:MAG: Short chain fatty acid transporter [Pseudomonadota bacterium]